MQEIAIVEKPSNMDEYLQWEQNKFSFPIDKSNYFDSAVEMMKEQFEKSTFWNSLGRRIKQKEEIYLRNTGFELLQNNFNPKILKKSYISYLDKSFRKNVLLNDSWPNEPEYGWIDVYNVYGKIGDLIRTNFVVRYLDGIDYILDALKEECLDKNVESIISYKDGSEGYYAVHFDVCHEFQVPEFSWKTRRVSGRVEIQITTQIKDVIRKLLHGLYAEKRIIDEIECNWQWNYKSPHFASSYLGHVLHYIEGTIMDLRERGMSK